MYKLDITPAAIRDETGAITYISDTLQNPSAAANLLEQIEKCYGILEDNPYIYSLCTDPQLSVLGYHKVIIKKYVMLYKIDTTKQVVHILRFVYGPSDYMKRL